MVCYLFYFISKTPCWLQCEINNYYSL